MSCFVCEQDEEYYPPLNDLFSGPNRHDVVLDLGCGWGRCLMHLAAHYDFVFGLDNDEDVLSCLRTHESFPDNVHLLRADAAFLPMRAESVSALLASALLCQLSPQAMPRVLEEMVRVLKPGGIAVLGICHPLRPVPEVLLGDTGLRVRRVTHLCDYVIQHLKHHCLDCDIVWQSPSNFWTLRAIKK